MVVGDPRRPLGVIVRLAEAAGVGELQADEQVVERAELLDGGRRGSSSSSGGEAARLFRAWRASGWGSPGRRAARRPLRRPRSASRRCGRSSASGAACSRSASRRGWRPNLPSDGCTSDCRRESRRPSSGAASGEPSAAVRIASSSGKSRPSSARRAEGVDVFSWATLV